MDGRLSTLPKHTIKTRSESDSDMRVIDEEKRRLAFPLSHMPSPPVQLFLTTIASQPALRQRQEYLLRILQVKKIPFTSYDLASDETAKRLWKRKAPLGINILLKS